mgnify:CR=1 FL=1
MVQPMFAGIVREFLVGVIDDLHPLTAAAGNIGIAVFYDNRLLEKPA